MAKYYKVIANNRKAFHDFNIQLKYKAGIVLEGFEVKSIRLGNVNFKDSFCRVDHEELWLYNMHVSGYRFTRGSGDQEPDRKRKLLLNKRETKKVVGKIAERGMVCVPLKIFLDGNWVKVEIGLGKSKKQFEKRDTLKKKDQQRDINRALRERKK